MSASSVGTEVSQGLQNPTRKQPWSVVGLFVMSFVTSAVTSVVVPMAVNAVKKAKSAAK